MTQTMTAPRDLVKAPLAHADDPRFVVRVGRDLQIAAVLVLTGTGSAASGEWHLRAFDIDGDYLSTLAVVQYGTTEPHQLLPSAIAAATLLYPEHLVRDA